MTTNDKPNAGECEIERDRNGNPIYRCLSADCGSLCVNPPKVNNIPRCPWCGHAIEMKRCQPTPAKTLPECNCGFSTGDTGFHQPWCADKTSVLTEQLGNERILTKAALAAKNLLMDERDWWQSAALARDEMLKVAVEALRKYASHKQGCHDHESLPDGPWGTRLPCTCGFAAALSTIAQLPPLPGREK